jgi:two-component system, NtrC family, response regulator GlrR
MTSDIGHTEAVRPGRAASVRRLRLRVVRGPDEGMSFESGDDALTIGSHEGADCRLTDPAISRFHCEIIPEADRVLIRDLESKNGTTVDGVRIVTAFLGDGSTIALGRSEVSVTFDAGELPLALSEANAFGSLAGRSSAMRRAFVRLEKAAQSDATVLLLGETGTGKEVATESIHEASARRDGPLVVVDCGAIPSQLLESELFGHVKGAFTGAVGDRPGAFRAAHGGTLFLDEVGELSLELQPKLLRALERRHVKRVGESRYDDVDVRVVAATHRDLKSEVNHGRFRADLYYRLAVLEIRLPPLRERLDDLPVLVERLVAAMGLAADHPFLPTLQDPSFVADLRRHAWPGNVRELRNFLERCVALQERAELTSLGPDADETGAPAIDPDVPLRKAREDWIAAFERRYLEALLARHAGNVSQAARAAGVNRGHFYRLLSRHELK